MLTRAFLTSSLALSVIAARTSSAQKAPADSVPPRFTVGSTQMVAGFITFDFAELDSRLASAGLPRAANSAATVGIGTDIRSGILLVGIGFQSLIARDYRDASYRTRLSGRLTMLDVGAAVVKTADWSVYPLVGVGATSLTVNLREVGSFTFDEALDRPGRELGMSGFGGLAHGGMLVERRFQRGDTEYAVALRTGVMRGFGSQLWSSDASRVANGPSGMNGYYGRLIFSRPMRQRRDAVVPFAGTVAQAAIR